MIRVLVIVVFALLALRGVRAFAQETHPRDAHISQVIPFTEASGVGAEGADDGLLSRRQVKAPHPAVVIIHGGGFTGGTSRNGSEAYCADFLDSGWVRGVLHQLSSSRRGRRSRRWLRMCRKRCGFFGRMRPSMVSIRRRLCCWVGRLAWLSEQYGGVDLRLRTRPDLR